MNRLLHIFFDTNLSAGHVGLAKRALEERKFKVSDMNTGDMLVFINRRKDRIKILAGMNEPDSNGILAYYVSPHGKIDEMALQYIPQAFSGGEIQYNKALKKALEERLQKK